MIEGVILIGVGRNLNRAIRTCYSFGVYDVYCLDCSGEISGNLFGAKKVRIHQLAGMDDILMAGTLALEKTKTLLPLHKVKAADVRYLAVGGETTTLRQKDFSRMARISTVNDLCLTTEAAIAIALYSLGGGESERL